MEMIDSQLLDLLGLRTTDNGETMQGRPSPLVESPFVVRRGIQTPANEAPCALFENVILNWIDEDGK